MVLAAVLGVNFIVVVAYLMNHFNIFTSWLLILSIAAFIP